MEKDLVNISIPKRQGTEDKIFNLCIVEIKEFPQFITNFNDIVGSFHHRFLSDDYKDLKLDHVSIRENGHLVHMEHHSILTKPLMSRDFQYLTTLHRASGRFIHPFIFNTGEIPTSTIEFASPNSFYNPVFVNTKEIEGSVRLNNINYKLNNNQPINAYDILDLIWMPTYRWDREIEDIILELMDIYNNLIVEENLLEVLRKSLVLWSGKHVSNKNNAKKVIGGLNMSVQEITNLEKAFVEARLDGIRYRAEKTGLEAGIEKGRKEGREEGREEGMKKGIEKGKLETARNMLNKGYSLEDIIDVTGLSEEEILRD